MRFFFKLLPICFVCLLTSSVFAYAQDQLDPAQQFQETNQIITLNGPKVEYNSVPSLFLTSAEENLIVDARKGLLTRRPTDSEFDSQQEGEGAASMGPREVTLGGILYVSSADWVVWLNKQKITPKNLAPEIIDIQVHKDYIKLKWLDSQTNQIYPIKLKSHQRFNLDTRIFLPG